MTPSHASSFSLFFFIDFVFVIKVKVSFLFFSVANLAVRFMVFSTFYIFASFYAMGLVFTAVWRRPSQMATNSSHLEVFCSFELGFLIYREVMFWGSKFL